MRCPICENIPLIEFTNPLEYIMAANAVTNMLMQGNIEMIYQTCPLDQIVDKDGKFYSGRIFHQFSCSMCGTIYGMLANPLAGGGEIKINDKPFRPEDYEGKDKE
ncbi:MAG: hypothetical protein IKR76_08060 [Ruminococcus sp.]|nr:hypothetical protein [Ruminococcus sp.]